MTTAKKTFDPWPAATVTAVADILADTDEGLSVREIGLLLERIGIADADGPNKRERLARALLMRQNRDRASNCVVRFITEAMAPVRYARQPEVFSRRRDDLNEVLVHVGLRVNDAGKLARGTAASTLDEAARHANSLRAELRRRGTHPKVLEYCTQEILAKNAFHASLQAAKSVFNRLRQLTGEQLDGARLVDAVLMPGAAGAPRVAINTGVTATERDEQKGFASLIKGLGSMYRNPAAHDPRRSRPVGDEELLELLTTLSMVHRRLDAARTQP
ncbi:TIGR02391 family protein [Streptomyces sp. NBC_01341]|uniref:TIGR02391 family protein n=1 Tax=Streptomyces sp. NBC_01341 TaxID=2903831 RepID=UPI002E1078F9|nr:TIGR02391 family protein [Streptomyces sp. NBC_01341]